jgi:signal peptidase I
MEPAFYRGDILFLNNGPAPITTGEVVVFNIDGRDIPIVHRVVKVHDRGAGPSPADDLERGRGGNEKAASPLPPRGAPAQDILTKGDNNWGDDRALYARGQKWLAREHVMGRVVG